MNRSLRRTLQPHIFAQQEKGIVVQFESIIELLSSFRPKGEISHVIDERSTAEMPPIVGMTNETLIYF